jgi:hypothetical protein
MRLNEEQLSVIKAVRAAMGWEGKISPYYSRYICHAVEKVLMDRVTEGLLSVAQAQTMKHHLATGILAGISHMVTFGGFMLATCPVFKEIYERDKEAYTDTVHIARLAWLDFIIETGEIKQDLLAGEAR